jgi:hypothetical protein
MDNVICFYPKCDGTLPKLDDFVGLKLLLNGQIDMTNNCYSFLPWKMEGKYMLKSAQKATKGFNNKLILG